MKCDICRGPIKPQLNESGEVVWDKGHNAWPLGSNDDARCCDACTGDVLLARILNMNAKIIEKKAQVPQ